MNDNIALIGSGSLGLFFFISGILDILDHFLVKMILFTGFALIIIYIILTTSKRGRKKNPPE